MARIKALSIYGYTDFRSYLSDFYAYRKQLPGGYSYRMFSRDAGFSSPNILKLVIEGKRNIGEKSFQSFINALKLEPKMGEYFVCLVRLNQSKTDSEKEIHFQKLRLLTPHSRKRKLSGEAYDYLNHWLNPLIREMVSLEGFCADPYWISRRIYKHVSTDEISKSLQFLIRENYIAQNDQGNFISNEMMVLSSDEIRSLSIRNYHRGMLELAKEMIQILDLDQREYGALTVRLPRNKMQELKDKLKAFRQDIHLWSIEQTKPENVQSKSLKSDPDLDVIIQLNMQMFPLSKAGSGS